jgi:hypothetical protein
LSSVADPGSDAFFTADFWMNNPDHISECFETIFCGKILQFFDADPGWKKIRKNTDPG